MERIKGKRAEEKLITISKIFIPERKSCGTLLPFVSLNPPEKGNYLIEKLIIYQTFLKGYCPLWPFLYSEENVKFFENLRNIRTQGYSFAIIQEDLEFTEHNLRNHPAIRGAYKSVIGRPSSDLEAYMFCKEMIRNPFLEMEEDGLIEIKHRSTEAIRRATRTEEKLEYRLKYEDLLILYTADELGLKGIVTQDLDLLEYRNKLEEMKELSKKLSIVHPIQFLDYPTDFKKSVIDSCRYYERL